MKCSVKFLLSHLDELLDQVAATGEPIEIRRKGRRLKIMVADQSGGPESPSKKVIEWTRRDGVVKGDPEELAHIDWSQSWKPDV
ncbi:MAG: type II toxin-antitoxin system Phd/YefM family antitoxin [Deltaproteobacteria bacterium]|nr:type II toxin-antitoxin system Phd/YefM family antitoxin [Deltaproteobacteria bacterium]